MYHDVHPATTKVEWVIEFIRNLRREITEHIIHEPLYLQKKLQHTLLFYNHKILHITRKIGKEGADRDQSRSNLYPTYVARLGSVWYAVYDC